MSPTVISYGGGVQSTAMLVLAVEGRLGLDIDAALFANVGDDSEDPRSLDYIRDVATPWAADRGLPVHELHRTKKDGSTETILGRMTRDGSRSTVIPIRLSNGKPGGRSCTADFKIGVTAKWLKAHGATKADPATVALGISTDEFHRANTNRGNGYERLVYPLLQLGLSRADCVNVIRAAGLPIPGKSACWFCPNRRLEQWYALRAEDPDQFERVAEVEDLLTERSQRLGQGQVFMTNVSTPLRDVVPEGVQVLPLWVAEHEDPAEAAGCDGGWCMT